MPNAFLLLNSLKELHMHVQQTIHIGGTALELVWFWNSAISLHCGIKSKPLGSSESTRLKSLSACKATWQNDIPRLHEHIDTSFKTYWCYQWFLNTFHVISASYKIWFKIPSFHFKVAIVPDSLRLKLCFRPFIKDSTRVLESGILQYCSTSCLDFTRFRRIIPKQYCFSLMCNGLYLCVLLTTVHYV